MRSHSWQYKMLEKTRGLLTSPVSSDVQRRLSTVSNKRKSVQAYSSSHPGQPWLHWLSWGCPNAIFTCKRISRLCINFQVSLLPCKRGWHQHCLSRQGGFLMAELGRSQSCSLSAPCPSLWDALWLQPQGWQSFPHPSSPPALMCR